MRYYLPDLYQNKTEDILQSGNLSMLKKKKNTKKYKKKILKMRYGNNQFT